MFIDLVSTDNQISCNVKAAKLLGLDVKSMGDFYSDDECTVAPAIGTAMMMKNYLD